MKAQVTHRPAHLSAQIEGGQILVVAGAGRDGGGKNGRQTSASDLHYLMPVDQFARHVEAQMHLLAEADRAAFESLVNRLVLHRAGLR